MKVNYIIFIIFSVLIWPNTLDKGMNLYCLHCKLSMQLSFVPVEGLCVIVSVLFLQDCLLVREPIKVVHFIHAFISNYTGLW